MRRTPGTDDGKILSKQPALKPVMLPNVDEFQNSSNVREARPSFNMFYTFVSARTAMHGVSKVSVTVN